MLDFSEASWSALPSLPFKKVNLAAPPGLRLPSARGATTAAASLSALPFEVLEEVCKHLHLRDRCVHLTPKPERCPDLGLQALLSSLAASPIKELSIVPTSCRCPMEWDADTLSPLSALRGLTLLEVRGYLLSQDALGQMPALQELLLCLGAQSSGSFGLPARPCPSTWLMLQPLTSLSRLDLCASGLTRVPPGLSACVRLADLHLGDNSDLGRAGRMAAAFQPLAQLMRLSRLNLRGMWNCLGGGVPREVSRLAALQDLDISDNEWMGISGAEAGVRALAPLRHLTALTRLDARRCRLSAGALGHLSGCTGLAWLNLEGNWPLGEREGGQVASAWVLQPFGAALTRLCLRGCKLESLPAQLACLSHLQDLDLSLNYGLGHGGVVRGGGNPVVWQPLASLAMLTYLCIRQCDLAAVPAQVACLSALVHIDLRNNELFRQLSGVPAAVPAGAAACDVMPGGWGVGSAAGAGSGGYGPLQWLRELRVVDLRECRLEHVPAELRATAAGAGLRVYM
ncbi:hypothetical protein N2152v2_010410 [Parachlorella kessleri]